MKRYALVIGIGDYDHLPNLSKPKSDAAAMQDVLQADNHFQVTLLNEGVTREKLRDALKTLLLKRGKNSDVLIYFTGHGFTAGEDEHGEQGYLATQDCRIEVEGKRVLSVHKGFSFQSLNGLIAEAELSSLVMLLDCCHGGSFIESAQAREKLSALNNKTCYCLVTACRSFEQAAAMRAAEHSIFSGAVLAALREESGHVTALDVSRRVATDLRGTGQESLYLGAGSDVVILERWQAPAVPALVSEECPYQGLNAFTPETEKFFKGREDEKALLRKKLNNSNFLPVLGPSGIGKSSVVRAGLITHLPEQDWCVVKMKPGSAPAAELVRQMKTLWSDLGLSTGEQRDLARVLESEGLLAVAEKMPMRKRVLLLVDQFEEVFTQCPEGKEAERDRFIQNLVRVGRAETPLAVVMTMRSDFVNEWLATGQPPEVMSNDTVCLGPLVGDGLRAAIVEPAQIQGYRFGPGLLELLLADVEREKNCLPLLEFALTELWEKRDKDKRELTAAAYREMGGLTGALNRRAEAVYDGLRPVEQDWAERICLQLVRIGREEKDTRQRQPQQRLLEMGDQDEQTRQTLADVISDLVKGRLLVGDSDLAAVAGKEVDKEFIEGVVGQGGSVGYVDLAHEALLEGWARLKAWRQENRDLRRLVQRLEDDYEKWKEEEESEDYLLKGGLLVELKEQREALSKLLREKGRPELTMFFSDSEEHDRKTVSALKEALAKAQIQETSRKIRDKLLFTPVQTVEATVAAINLVGESQEKLDQVTYPAQDALHHAWFNVRECLKLEGHSGSVESVAFSPQGDCIVSGSRDNTLRLWNLKGNAVSSPFEGHSSSVHSVAFSPQGDRIASGSRDRTLRLWDLEGNPVGSPLGGHSNWVYSVAFSPQGDHIVSGSRDRTLRLWDLEGNAIGSPFEGHSGSVYSAVFSPQGDHIVSNSSDGTLRLWDLEGNAVGSPFEGHSFRVYSIAFGPQGDRIISGGYDETLRLWNLKGSTTGSLSFEGHGGWIYSVAFSPQGDRIVSGSHANKPRLWDLEGNAIGLPFEGHSSSIRSVAFSPQGDRIISGSHDETLRLWDLEGNAIGSPFEGHSGSVESVAFSSKGDHIVSGSRDKTLRLWDLEGNAIGLPFEGHSGWVYSVAFSPQDDHIVSGSRDNMLRLWDLKGNAIGLPFKGHSRSVRSVAFSPQGDHIVSGSDDNTLQLWDLEGNAIGSPFEGHSSWVRSVAFSSKGDRIVSGSDDKTLRLWDLEGNTIGLPFEGHSNFVYSAAFSPRGDCIVSGSRDKTLRLWRVGTWEDELRYCCNTLMHHPALASPDSETARNACEVCEQVWTRQQSAEFAVAQGSALARRGEVKAAIAKLNRAKELNPELTIESAARANELAEWG